MRAILPWSVNHEISFQCGDAYGFLVLPPHPSQVIARSGGVVFVEQLAPILNPRQGPLRRGSSHDRMSGRDEALVLRALLDLNGAPEVKRPAFTLSARVPAALLLS